MLANPEMAAVAVIRSSLTSKNGVSTPRCNTSRTGGRRTVIAKLPFTLIGAVSLRVHWLLADTVKASVSQDGGLDTR